MPFNEFVWQVNFSLGTTNYVAYCRIKIFLKSVIIHVCPIGMARKTNNIIIEQFNFIFLGMAVPGHFNDLR